MGGFWPIIRFWVFTFVKQRSLPFLGTVTSILGKPSGNWFYWITVDRVFCWKVKIERTDGWGCITCVGCYRNRAGKTWDDVGVRCFMVDCMGFKSLERWWSYVFFEQVVFLGLDVVSNVCRFGSANWCWNLRDDMGYWCAAKNGDSRPPHGKRDN